MEILTESVKSYLWGLFKIVKKTKKDNQNNLVKEKAIYFFGLKIYESSDWQQQFMRICAGEIE